MNTEPTPLETAWRMMEKKGPHSPSCHLQLEPDNMAAECDCGYKLIRRLVLDELHQSKSTPATLGGPQAPTTPCYPVPPHLMGSLIGWIGGVIGVLGKTPEQANARRLGEKLGQALDQIEVQYPSPVAPEDSAKAPRVDAEAIRLMDAYWTLRGHIWPIEAAAWSRIKAVVEPPGAAPTTEKAREA